MAATKPEKVFRLGNVSASVFANEIEQDGIQRTLRSVTIQKRYQDGNETKYKPNFNISELPLAIRVAQLAQQHVEHCEAEIQLSD
ncbi:hypothetical protein [Calycomorphotria hydatis]|uniref:Uncharacterized protein n=1 Tax=Calycomorphotria hydatis TaxID=2528027 RepID=A0A517T6T4_9PLAN|nr:hypothetical protein [Calycomorphotria hydatis]QDT64067.1 hypothetical protein V22_12980 [Calycomorphotria hydatis]